MYDSSAIRCFNSPPYTAPAAFSKSGKSFLRDCRSEFPPMCFFAMKIFGTDRWPVILSSAS